MTVSCDGVVAASPGRPQAKTLLASIPRPRKVVEDVEKSNVPEEDLHNQLTRDLGVIFLPCDLPPPKTDPIQLGGSSRRDALVEELGQRETVVYCGNDHRIESSNGHHLHRFFSFQFHTLQARVEFNEVRCFQTSLAQDFSTYSSQCWAGTSEEEHQSRRNSSASSNEPFHLFTLRSGSRDSYSIPTVLLRRQTEPTSEGRSRDNFRQLTDHQRFPPSSVPPYLQPQEH